MNNVGEILRLEHEDRIRVENAERVERLKREKEEKEERIKLETIEREDWLLRAKLEYDKLRLEMEE